MPAKQAPKKAAAPRPRPLRAAGHDWRALVLDQLGAPTSDDNVRALQLWHQSEGTPEDWNNWLATTIDGHGGRIVNSAGVKQYPTVEDGVAATVATLRLSYYDLVVKHLQTGAALVDIFSAINQSPWCGGCQGGHYPLVLWEFVMSTHADPTHVPGFPEYDVKMTDAVARKDGGVYVLGADGGVFTFHGAPFFGSFPGMPDKVVGDRSARGQFVSITLDQDEAGYTLTDEHGEAYHLTAAIWAQYLAEK